jgi:hypothetical protein
MEIKALPPLQIVVEPLIVAVGNALIVTEVSVVFEQPLESVKL